MIAFSCVRLCGQPLPVYGHRPCYTPPLGLLVTLLIALTGAIRGRGPVEFCGLQAVREYAIMQLSRTASAPPRICPPAPCCQHRAQVVFFL